MNILKNVLKKCHEKGHRQELVGKQLKDCSVFKDSEYCILLAWLDNSSLDR